MTQPAARAAPAAAPQPSATAPAATRLTLDALDGVVHLVGIGGIGVSAVARLLLARGVAVRGSDVRASQLTEMLQTLGADVRVGHSADHLDGVAMVVRSTAIPATNVELVAAAARGIPIVHRSEVLGMLLDDRESVGVIGTHGKGTTSGAVAWLLDAAGLAPGYIIGGLLENWRDNARDGARWMVAEVDESDGSLVNTRPTIALLNNLELDHLNYYKDWAQLAATIERFFLANERLRTAIFNVADEGARAMAERVGPALRARGVAVITFGFAAGADVQGVELQHERMRGRFEVLERSEAGVVDLGAVEISLPGAYNASNVLGAIAVARAAGVAWDVIARAAPAYRGLENRFTLVEAAGIEIVKDYISHPTGIRRVLEAAAAQAEGELVAVFKPYRFTMIHYLQDDYALAFEKADRVIVTELYTAGEVPIPGVDTELLCRRIRERAREVSYVHELEAIPGHLEATTAAPATVLFFGGDDLFRMADAWAARRLSAGAEAAP
jgi:UDP-N-acetylmuramate--alanine ligase